MQARSYRVVMVVKADGERFPLLTRDGMPLWATTLYSLTELRAKNRATKTLEAHLRALALFYVFLDQHGIDLDYRISEGETLHMHEVDELIQNCRLQMREAYQNNAAADSLSPGFRIGNLERFRKSPDMRRQKSVVPHLAATRIQAICNYFEWLMLDRIDRIRANPNLRQMLETSFQRTLNALRARSPRIDLRGKVLEREGLSLEAQRRLLEVIDPWFPGNPWRNWGAKVRNQLIIEWLYRLGVRRGELLGIRIGDIDFRKGQVTIHRRADDKQDPRKNQPNVKTKARVLSVDQDLLKKTQEYIMNFRRRLEGARRHDFLFVTVDTGKPISIPAFDKIFKVLRSSGNDLPVLLFAHLLRHTWNDNFSRQMDKNEVPEDKERKYRSYLMGWSETSGTAATYTRRHTRKVAEKISLSMQARVIGGGRDA
ncbi:integrase family protein [Pusillimonas sp. T7-7]|uniref:Integrase n=2 Tax=Pseudomonadota TaxID=1224 RepID=A0ABT2R234_9GAMM|nr:MULTISPECIES: site-specific integrase [Pseudomonadota]AEC21385.1 integrase family protein [Pusillimonas sp. T7-7]MCU5783824.1 integrase [Alloalcanivorax balearicus MACL04]QXX77928.1 site-specific integrase [Alcaligenes ammonioxydans]